MGSGIVLANVLLENPRPRGEEMVSLELNTDDAALLKEYLERELSDLSYEIANTDRKDYRDQIKAQRDRLRAIANQLPAASKRAG
jgi:hypothetical protein